MGNGDRQYKGKVREQVIQIEREAKIQFNQFTEGFQVQVNRGKEIQMYKYRNVNTDEEKENDFERKVNIKRKKPKENGTDEQVEICPEKKSAQIIGSSFLTYF